MGVFKQEVVIHRNGKDLTLQQVFESLNLQAHELSVDSLDVHVRHGAQGNNIRDIYP